MALSETWLDDSISDTELALENYNLFRKERNRHGGGVAVYVRSPLTVSSLDSVKSTESSFESLWISISGCQLPSSVAFCVCYRPPSSSSNFVDSFSSDIKSVLAVSRLIVVCGDFNVNLLNNSSLTTKFHNCCLLYTSDAADE